MKMVSLGIDAFAHASRIGARMRVYVWVVLSVTFILLMGCTDGGQDQAMDPDILADPWQYPIRVGDSRATVRDLLGPPYHTSTPVWDEFPTSGVSLMFDVGGRVTKLYFVGEADAHSPYIPSKYIPSDRPVLFGLSGHSDEEDFRLALGSPVAERLDSPGHVFLESEGRLRPLRGVRLIWRKEGYVVEGLFVAEERGYRENPYDKGTLSQFEVYRGL